MTGTLGFLRGAATVSSAVTGGAAGVETGLAVGATGCSILAEDDGLFCDHALRLAVTVTNASSKAKKNGARIFLDNCMMTSSPVVLLPATLTGGVADAATLKSLYCSAMSVLVAPLA